ncbi:MAG TPA: cell division protein ZapD [Candidatus Binatia bacterium]|nr:cell division protein ZapD [Candidatus Binatia bacterium]
MIENGHVIAYEQPLNERVRTFLRLEFLFAQYRHHGADRSPWGVRASLRTLLDILSVVSRSDLKTEVLKELGEQHAALTRLQQRPGVDPTRLQSVLAEIGEATHALQAQMTHTLATVLRDNEFLVSLLHRSTIPGGASAFDLPGFHHWLSLPAERTRRDLEAWFADLGAFERAINLYLRLLRHSTEATAELARGGMFVYTPQGEADLVRVLVAADNGVYPEISAGRHRFTVRFMTQRDVNSRAVQAVVDIPFQLQCCAL